MNITIITCFLPWPLYSGGAQAQFNIINHIRHQHNITLIFQTNRQNTNSAMHYLQQLWPEVNIIKYPIWRQLLSLSFFKDKAGRAIRKTFTPNSRAFQVQKILKPYGFCISKDFSRYINKIIKTQKTDLLQVEFYPCLDMIEYLPNHIKKIFVHHELRYIRNERMTKSLLLTQKEENFLFNLKQHELSMLNKYDAIITLTEQDRNFLIRDGIYTPIHVSPAAVNSTPMTYVDWNGSLSFVGGYAHIPNKEGIDWFLKEVVSTKEDFPHLNIIGTGWPESYNTQNSTTKGFVESLPEAIHDTIMIVPLLTGSGMRMKILDAAALSIPFVTTSVGVEGLKFKPGESCMVANNAREFADAIMLLKENSALRKRIGENANIVFNSFYSAKHLAEVRNKIYETL